MESIKVRGPKSGTSGEAVEIGKIVYSDLKLLGHEGILSGEGAKQLIALLGKDYMKKGFHLELPDGLLVVSCRIMRYDGQVRFSHDDIQSPRR